MAATSPVDDDVGQESVCELSKKPAPGELSQRHIAQVLSLTPCCDPDPEVEQAAGGPAILVLPNEGSAGRAAAVTAAAAVEHCTGVEHTLWADERDVAWLLSSLRLAASAEEGDDEGREQTCGEAWKELKQLTKFAPETFWEKNCAQVRTMTSSSSSRSL
jgi:hypothetical protein